MKLKECPHCITKVIFSNSNICPSCNKNNLILPNKSREEIIEENDKIETERKIAYCTKYGPIYIVAGFSLIIILAIIFFIILASGNLMFVWIGGFIFGMGIVSKGTKLINEADEFKYQYEQRVLDRKKKHKLTS